MILRRFIQGQGIVILLLLLHFALRTHNIDAQFAYVDEGYHISRALHVWTFEENPGRFAHGKPLVYFWIGLFTPNNTNLTILPVARLSIAIFSVMTSAGLYLLARLLMNHAAGVIAAGLYAVMPLALWYERMAMADPLVAALAVLAAWRCWVFVRRPTLREGVVLGLLLGLGTLAKLTAALVVLLPLCALAIFYGWRKGLPQIHRAVRVYLPPLLIAAIIVAGMWAPMLVPAYFAHIAGDPFIIVNDTNIATTEEYLFNPVAYLERLLPLLAEFTSPGFLAIMGLAVFAGIILPGGRRLRRASVYTLIWLLLLTVLTLLIARLTTTRYFLPAVGPVILSIALVAGYGWMCQRLRWLLRSGIAVLVSAWVALWVIPLTYTMLTTPNNMPFSGINHTEYVAGYLVSDEAVQQAAAHINALDDAQAVAVWNLCHLLLFHLERDVPCLPRRTPLGSLLPYLRALEEGEYLYLLHADYPPYYEDIADTGYEVLGVYHRERIRRPVSVIKLWRMSD